MSKRRAIGATAVALFLASSAAGSPPGLGDVAGVWTVVSSEGPLGVLDLEGAAGRWSAERRAPGTERGTAVAGGEHLFVAYRRAATPGIVGALDGRGAGRSSSAIDVYEWDSVERAFHGVHAGRSESLRRPLAGNAVDLFVNGDAMFPAYLAAIASARETVHCECYEWRDDDVGARVGAALAERARAGVKVRVVMDGISSRKAKGLARRMSDAGCEVRFWNEIGLASIRGSLVQAWRVLRGVESLSEPAGNSWEGLDNRDHRKTLVVDGRVAFVGGMNLTHEFIHEWHDVHTRLRGPAVAAVQRHFVDTWRRMGGSLSEARLYPPLEAAGALSVDVATTLPGVRDELKRIYLARIAAARSEVLLETPFFGDVDVVKALESAAKRGVRVVLVLPGDDVNAVPLMAAHHARLRPGLLAAGIDVRSYPKMSHGKVAVIERRWATVGSCNLDNRSFERDLEENVCVDDEGFAREVRSRVFEADLRVARRCRLTDPATSLLRRAMGAIGGKIHAFL